MCSRSPARILAEEPGIQADLKAFAACRVHGMTAVTAITAQNTMGVTAVHGIPPDVIVAQVQAVQDDIGVDAAKIGMLGDLETIRAVAEPWTSWHPARRWCSTPFWWRSPVPSCWCPRRAAG